MKKIFILSFIVVSVLGILVKANAELHIRGTDILGNQLIYDSDLNITWYDYTKSYDNWQNQNMWASALEVNFGGTVFDDWRLPYAVDGQYAYGYNGTTTAGYNITNSEMGYLFYSELGNLGYLSTLGIYQPGYGLSSTGLFMDLRPDNYWSGTEYAENPASAWGQRFGNGALGTSGKTSEFYALAVRSGDVPQLAVVPEPLSVILFVAGGLLLVVRTYLRRSNKQRHSGLSGSCFK